MAISHVNSENNTQANATSVTVTKPTGTTSNDLLVAFFSSNNQACTPPAGWISLDDQVTEVFRTQVFYKVAGGSEAANYTFSIDASAPIVATVSCFRGADTSDPMDAASAATSLTHSEPYTTPSITGATTGRLLYYRTSRMASSSIPTYTASGATEISEDGVFSGGSVSYAQGVYLATADYTGSSQSGLAITCSTSESHNVVMTIGIKTLNIPGTASVTLPSIPGVAIDGEWSVPGTLGAAMPIPSMTADIFNGNTSGSLGAQVLIAMSVAANVNPQGPMDVVVLPTMGIRGETRRFAENVVTVDDEYRWFIILQDDVKIGNRRTARRELIVGAVMPLPGVDLSGYVSIASPIGSATAYSPAISIKPSAGAVVVNAHNGYVSDDFNRANGALGLTSSGHAWTVHSGAMTIASNQVSCSSTGTATLSTGMSDGYVSITCTTSAKLTRVHFRRVDANNYWEWGTNTAAWRLTKYIAGVPTNFLEIPGNVTSGETVSARFEGSTISVYQNNVLAGSFSDSSHVRASLHGFQVQTGGTVDDFEFADSGIASGSLSLAAPVPTMSASGLVDFHGPLQADMPLPTVDFAAKKVNIVYAVDIGNGSTTSFTVTHNLDSKDVLTAVYETASPYEEVQPTSIERTTTNTITVTFPAAPTTNQYRVVVVYG